VPATEAEIKSSIKAEKTADDLLKVIPIGEELRIEKILQIAKTDLSIGQNRTRALLRDLVDCDKVVTVLHQRSGTNPEKRYKKTDCDSR
jgi:hypothetical protein